MKASNAPLCGDESSARWACVVYGAFAATLSRVKPAGTAGNTTQRLTSVAVPFAAFRFVPFPAQLGYVSLDLGAYSAFLTNGLTASTPTSTKTPCARSATNFEEQLPCEANVELLPYAAGYVGISLGRRGRGYAALVPYTVGMAQVGGNKDLRWFHGSMLGLLTLNGEF